MAGSWSIRRQLVRAWLLMLVLVSGVVYLIAGEVAKRTLERGQDSDLQAVAWVILDSVVQTPDGVEFDLPFSAFEVLAYSAPERVFYRVRLGETHLAGYADLPNGQQTDRDLSFFSAVYRGEPSRFVVASKPIRPTAGEIIEVSIGQTQASYLAFANRVANWLAVAVLAAFASLALWAEWSLRFSLKPFRAIEANLQSRSADDFSPIDEDTPIEINRLVQTFNVTMDRHRELLEANRAFIAEATHQIKTPIAVMMTAAEVLEQRLPESFQADARQVVVRARYASKLVTQLLTRASLTYREMLNIQETVDLCQVAHSVVRTLDAKAEARDIGLSLNTPDQPVYVMGDRVAIREALVCLIDNAITHTPVLSEVVVAVERRETSSVLSVTDNGPGFPVESLRERSIDDDLKPHPGRGLGLVIASRVAQSHGGRLVCENLCAGGARCLLVFG